MGFGTPLSEEGLKHIRANFIAGMRVGGAFSFGVGTGLRAFTDQNEWAVPLFFDLRFSSQNPGWAPIFAVGAGTVFHPVADWDRKGTHFYFEGGVRLGEPRGVAILLTAGYEQFASLGPLERRVGSFGFFTSRPLDVVSAFTINFALVF